MLMLFLVLAAALLMTTLAMAYAKTDNLFQEESKSSPLKIVVNLDYSEQQFHNGVGKVSIFYEDSDGYKTTKTYDFDMMKRAWPDPVKIKAKFPRNTMIDYEDYLICVTTLQDNHHKCVNESRSPGTNKERVHIHIP